MLAVFCEESTSKYKILPYSLGKNSFIGSILGNNFQVSSSRWPQDSVHSALLDSSLSTALTHASCFPPGTSNCDLSCPQILTAPRYFAHCAARPLIFSHCGRITRPGVNNRPLSMLPSLALSASPSIFSPWASLGNFWLG
jgi:hypothetical protein